MPKYSDNKYAEHRYFNARHIDLKKLKSQHMIKSILIYTFVLLIGLCIGRGVQYLHNFYTQAPNVIKADTTKHFINTETKVVVYVTSWCGFCKKTLALLDQLNVKYKKYDIESGDKSIQNRFKSIGYSGVPKTIIGNKIINGFNKSVLVDELKLNKLL